MTFGVHPRCDTCGEPVHEEFDWFDMLPGQFVGGWLCSTHAESAMAAHDTEDKTATR